MTWVRLARTERKDHHFEHLAYSAEAGAEAWARVAWRGHGDRRGRSRARDRRAGDPEAAGRL